MVMTPLGKDCYTGNIFLKRVCHQTLFNADDFSSSLPDAGSEIVLTCMDGSADREEL